MKLYFILLFSFMGNYVTLWRCPVPSLNFPLGLRMEWIAMSLSIIEKSETMQLSFRYQHLHECYKVTIHTTDKKIFYLSEFYKEMSVI